ncbi:MAG: DNA replication and repair protein RecF, partial [Rikenellaceae bacterium]
VDRNYLQSLIRYNSLLTDRNKLLKSTDDETSIIELLDVIDFQLCECATQIHSKRSEFISMLSPAVSKAYEKISLGREDIQISYRSELSETDYASLLIKNFEKDRILGHTSSGIHRDDMVIKIGDHPIKRFGSWGQQKSMLIALKLSEFDMIYARSGIKPILLLDDIFDKLDMSRVEALLSLVYSEKYGQIFITDSNKTRLLSILHNINKDYRLFSVDSGIVTLIDE